MLTYGNLYLSNRSKCFTDQLKCILLKKYKITQECALVVRIMHLMMEMKDTFKDTLKVNVKELFVHVVNFTKITLQ